MYLGVVGKRTLGKFWETPARTKTPEAHGPNICIYPHRACWHVKCVRGGARGSWMFVCFLMFAGREPWPGVSPEELLTSSRHSGPLDACGPLQAHSFLALHFRIIFRDVFLYSFSYIFGFQPPLWLYAGVIFYVFCITFLHGFVINFARTFYILVEEFVLISIHGPTSNWRTPQKHLFLHYFCIVYKPGPGWVGAVFKRCGAACAKVLIHFKIVSCISYHPKRLLLRKSELTQHRTNYY